VDTPPTDADNVGVNPSVEEQVERFRQIMEKVRAEINTPAKARAFLARVNRPQKFEAPRDTRSRDAAVVRPSPPTEP
jgi:hypothetical protein